MNEPHPVFHKWATPAPHFLQAGRAASPAPEPHVLESKVGEPLTREEYEAGRAVMDRLPPGIYAKCTKCSRWVTDDFSYKSEPGQPLSVYCSGCGG